jgi:hypothetical protein
MKEVRERPFPTHGVADQHDQKIKRFIASRAALSPIGLGVRKLLEVPSWQGAETG